MQVKRLLQHSSTLHNLKKLFLIFLYDTFKTLKVSFIIKQITNFSSLSKSLIKILVFNKVLV